LRLVIVVQLAGYVSPSLLSWFHSLWFPSLWIP